MSLWLSETQLNIISKTILLETHFIRRVDSFSGCVIITTFNEYNSSGLICAALICLIFTFLLIVFKVLSQLLLHKETKGNPQESFYCHNDAKKQLY